MSSSIIKALINSTIKEETGIQPLTFTCTASNLYSATIKFEVNGSPNISGLQYRKGTSAEWEQLSVPTTLYIPTGESWQFQNTNDTLSNSTSNYLTIKLDSGAAIKLTGNINSLVNYKELSTYCFYNLFKLSYATIDASELILPDTVANECYNNMFNFCKNLIAAPVLPAKVLATGCYSNMFKDCQNLITAPELPATSLVDYCYNQMFQSCSKLKNAPVLHATTLKPHCYNSMFKYCKSLTEAPELPATSLAMYCYNAMFSNCTSLTTAPFLPATSLYTGCYNEMFQNCSSLNYIKVGFSDYYLGNYSSNWVNGVSPTGTFASTTKFNTLKFGPSAIPEGWAVEGRNIIYTASTASLSLPIFENFEQSITYTTLPATDKPATYTIVEGELPETIKLTSSKGFTGYAESEQPFNIKVKIEIEGYEPAYKTVSFNFYKEAKLADYKLYMPMTNIDTVSVNDGDANNPLSFTQYNNSYPVKFVEQEGRWSFENWKVAEISGGSGYSLPTLVGKNTQYQKLPSGNNPWSVSFTMKLKQYSTDTSKSVNVIQIGYGYSAGKYIRFGLMPYNGKAYFYLDTYNMDDANFSDEAKESRIIELDKWYNIVVTYQDKTLNYYYNDELIATTTLANDLNLDTSDASTYFYIGGYSSQHGWRGASTECYMKDLLVFNRVLTEAEVDTLYKVNVYDFADSGEDLIYLTAANFTEEDASYYNVSSLNGDYYLVDETLTGINKVYKNEDNGIFIIFNKEHSCWMFSADDSVGGIVYTKSLDVMSWPIERMGDTLQWVRSGVDIEGTVKGYIDIDFPEFPDILPPGLEPEKPTNSAAFRVTDAGSTEANGDYYDTGETRTVDSYGTFPIYKNDNNIYMYFSSQCGYSWAPGWCLSPNIIDEGAGMLYCTAVYEGYETGMLASWSSLDGISPAPKCYELDSNGNIILPVDYTVTGAGTAAVNGYYYNTGETKGNYSVYANSNGVKLWFFNMMGGWVFSNDYSESTSDWYYHCEAYGDVTTGNWANDALYPTVDALGAEPLPTVTKGKVETDEPTEPDEPQGADYVVSGAGTEVVNGDYVAYESSYTAYKHTTNDIYLWYDSNLMKWYICMTGPGTTGVAEIYYETPVDCPDPTIAGWFTGEYAGSAPAPTVTKGVGSSGGESEGYTITYFRDMPALQANYVKTTAPSWGNSSYTYYKHETMDIYLYTNGVGGYIEIRSFDSAGFTSDYWFTAPGQNIEDYDVVVDFINKNSGAMHGATVTTLTMSDGNN